MSDLISRKTLLERLKFLGWLEPDEFDTEIKLPAIINEIPVSYDVDKVVKQLEDERQSALAMAYDSEYFSGQLSLLNRIIPLVKRGGIDDE